jgi:ABC-type Fe3+/spermidine/putrescine transport system ATPase subunit
MLETVHMRGYGQRYPGSLSGGEKQRIALARSLVYQPSLLLLDEPLANLDANLKESLIREIKDIQRKLGITAIYVTHDQSEAFEIADRIVIMNEGKIMQQGTPQEIYNHSQNLFVADFIGKNNIFTNAKGALPGFLARHCHCKARKAVAVRPEDIELSENGAHQGVIEKAIFKGDRIEYVILCSGGAHLTTFVPGNEIYAVGESVRFEVKRCQIL